MVLADSYPGGSLIGALFCLLWFLLVFMMSITVMFVYVKTVTAGLRDALHWDRQLIVTLYCVFSFAISLLMCKKVYSYAITDVLVKHSGNSSLFLLAGLQMVAIYYVLGVRNRGCHDKHTCDSG